MKYKNFLTFTKFSVEAGSANDYYFYATEVVASYQTICGNKFKKQ